MEVEEKRLSLFVGPFGSSYLQNSHGALVCVCMSVCVCVCMCVCMHALHHLTTNPFFSPMIQIIQHYCRSSLLPSAFLCVVFQKGVEKVVQ
jgi:hypothetical protein